MRAQAEWMPWEERPRALQSRGAGDAGSRALQRHWGGQLQGHRQHQAAAVRGLRAVAGIMVALPLLLLLVLLLLMMMVTVMVFRHQGVHARERAATFACAAARVRVCARQ